MTLATRIKKQEEKEPAYLAGFAVTSKAPCPNISPSLAQREEWGYAWSLYLRGWAAGKLIKNRREE